MGAPSQQDVAERLGHWLGAFDAIKLDGVLHSIKSRVSERPIPGPAVDAGQLERTVQTAKAELLGLIDTRLPSALPARGQAAPNVDDSTAASSHAMHQQRYLDLQQQMSVRLAQCRAQVRQGMSLGKPQWRQLAVLDASMEQMLGRHEQKLWAQLPVCLERRFEYWRQSQPLAEVAAGQEEEPAQWPQSGDWRHAYGQDQRALLLAEMDVRLQPILGLLEAVRNEHREHA